MDIQKGRKDLLAGGIFVAFGLAYAGRSATYDIGTPLRMGPGYFPLVLGGLLVLLGVLVVVKGFVAAAGEGIGPIPWRSAVLLLAAVCFFGYTVRGLGLVPSLLVTTLLSALAGHRTGIVAAAVIAAGLTILCILIFVTALQLRLPLIGPWIPV